LPDADGFKNGDDGEAKNKVLSLLGYIRKYLKILIDKVISL
jgi:hypothetical protein